MATGHLCLIFGMVSTFSYVGSSGVCSLGWLGPDSDDMCYLSVETELSFDEAVEYCANNDAIIMMPKYSYQYENIDSLGISFNNQIWIGLKSVNETWTWNDGTTTTDTGFTPWKGGNSDPGELCVVTRKHNSNISPVEWWTSDCSTTRNTVCQRLLVLYDCPSGWIRAAHKRECYYILWGYIMVYPTAMDFCDDYGEMVAPKTKEETIYVARSLGSGRRAWIALADYTTEGVYKWLDGTNLETAYWAKYEPSPTSYNQDCVTITAWDGEGYWDDRHCSSWYFKYMAICQCSLPVPSDTEASGRILCTEQSGYSNDSIAPFANLTDDGYSTIDPTSDTAGFQAAPLPVGGITTESTIPTSQTTEGLTTESTIATTQTIEGHATESTIATTQTTGVLPTESTIATTQTTEGLTTQSIITSSQTILKETTGHAVEQSQGIGTTAIQNITAKRYTEVTTEQTTEAAETVKGTTSPMCRCPCKIITTEELSDRLNSLTAKLKVDKKNLTSTVRKLTCAEDPRQSSRSIGYLGVCLLSGFFTLLLIIDFIPK